MLTVLISFVRANWRLIDLSFTDKQISQNQWKTSECCPGYSGNYGYSSFSLNDSIEKNVCSSNQLEYVRLTKQKRYLEKSFRYKSYQVQIIFDAFFDGAISQNSELSVTYDSNRGSNDMQLYIKDYDQSDLIQDSRLTCHSSLSKFQLETIVSNSVSSNSNNFSIQICFDPYDHRCRDGCDWDHQYGDPNCNDDYIQIGIRNLLVYIKACHPTCLTCDGPTESDCLSCYDNQSVQNGECKCIDSQQFSETFIGCRQECNRDDSIARDDKICVEDTRIKSKFTLFQDDGIPQQDQRYLPLIFGNDEFYPKNTDLVFENCNGKSFIGKLQYSEGMVYQMSLENQVKFIRIRITFYLFNFQQTSEIQILHNNQLQSKIIKNASGFQVENLLKIYEKADSCSSSYTLLRAEMTFQLFNSNPTIYIQGQLQQESESWGMRNITIDTGFCQENCLICSGFSTCSQCDSGYNLYKNQCVQTCPIYSSNCIDYEDIIPYSRYLAKGFYNLNMTYDEIVSFYDQTTDPSFSLSTKQKFSFLNNKIVLGGLLVWNDGSYKKTWNIQKPHYAVSIYFNLTYGDGYTGSFKYKVGLSSNTYSTSFNNPGGGSNLIGRTGLESTRYFNVSLTNFYDNSLYVEFLCDAASTNITKEFCAISDYFIVVHYCPPFCLGCTSLTTCNGGYSGPNCAITQYLDFNSITQVYNCKDCTQPGCHTCISLNECTQCKNNKFQLLNGICLCNPFTFLQGDDCIKCNKYCENCYGSSNNNCLTCVQDHHRGIKRHQCLCLPGYYDDGINLPCLPLCGDLIVVEQEDCDDGNNNPFDGCHNCKFACNFACDICLNGKCYQCKNGYEVHNNDCRSLCQGNQLTLLQQCTENSRNCVNCQYECSLNCVDCRFGKCSLCDEHRGWYAQIDGTCNSICGDGIVTSLTEMCDDGNTNQQDGCSYCRFSCDTFCQTCINSLCVTCQNGYYLIENKCVPICQDGQLVFPEQCEDGNIAPFDGCFNCKFQCSEYCIDCQFGICQKCNEAIGWYLQNDGSCQSICGDNILVLQNEECDNNTIRSVCNQCQITCDKNCSNCNKGICIKCIEGYKLEQSIQKCIKVCQNGIIVKQESTCEDGNNLLNDGCYQCQLSCQQSCTLCSKIGCLECNTTGWVLNQLYNKCETVCGDGITVQNYEECDDLTDQNCFRCKFDCQDSCLICYKGNCLKCKLGWFLNLDQKCYSSTGDSQIVGDEQCDDKNSLMYDGCYLSKYQCQQQCNHCEFGKCIQCLQGYQNLDGKCYEILNDGQILGNEQCDDQNLIAEDGCFNGQFDCPEDCEQCYQGQCLLCNKESTQLNTLNNQCISLCGNGQLSHNEQCDDANNIPYDGCFLCEFSCNYYCQTCHLGVCSQCQMGYQLDQSKNICQSICGDGIVTHDEQCDDGNLLQYQECVNCKLICQEQCINCVDGQCFECVSIGWQLNLIDMNCQPICGDLLIVGDEQCDDGNDINDDGCIDCYFQCQEQCTLCEKGECRECNTEGWQLNINRCTTICGDKLVINREECDDGNITPHDGCYECKFQCQEQCTDCLLGVCQACIKPGWVLNLNNLCATFCGDGVTIQPYEQCDDGNITPYDGCHYCEFQCEQLCTLCELGICYECNQLGWIIQNNQCTPFCGDGLVVGYEQCDDMNSIENDGCYECKFMCDQYCIDCEEGICKECPAGMHLFDHICQPKCGDAFNLKLFEQCDDGNIENGDGCNSKCQIEKDWICINNLNTFSVCTYEKQPDFSIISLTPHPQEFSDIQIVFTQQVKFSPIIQNKLNTHILTSLPDFEDDDYKIEFKKEIEIIYDQVIDLVLEYRVTFLSPLENPVFQIEFIDNPILSEFNQTLSKKQARIKLQTPIVLAQTQIDIASQASSFNERIIISLMSISSICLLTGQSDIFWNLMDQLQYLSYVKYINIQFSPNLNIYFELFKIITISPLISALGFETLFNSLDGEKQYFVQTKNKFLKDEVNAYFFTNFQSFIFCILTTYLSFFSAQILYFLLRKIQQKEIVQIGFIVGKQIIKARSLLKQKISEFYYNAILRILLSNSYDISFACAIQLANYPTEDNPVLIFNYYLSFLMYFGIIVSILYLIRISSVFSQNTSFKNKSKYKAVFDGINQNKNIWTFQYNSIQMIKKLIFISFVVFLQENGYIQVIAISILQTFFLMHTILNKPLDNINEYIKIVITETIIIFNVLSFLIYHYKIELELSSESVITLGWLHIITFSSILAITFILDILQQIKKLINVIINAINKPKQQLEPIFY
ncbi:unnamed protein product [Paramecium sonneborni]|uniref:EGF-like domain-containing protein n=1 Tax=Paramecium sonneborni TaxID=65129 RepID=A0A8S1RE71_9CILI|nr:unnamed protein product [Paramecium sonneborni]